MTEFVLRCEQCHKPIPRGSAWALSDGPTLLAIGDTPLIEPVHNFCSLDCVKRFGKAR